MSINDFLTKLYPISCPTLYVDTGGVPANRTLYNPTVDCSLYNFCTLNPISPHKPRGSLNVLEFRNFLFESDSLPLELQRTLWQRYAATSPVTALTYSGGKSYHAIISLADTFSAAPGTEAGVHRYKLAWLGLHNHIKDFFTQALHELKQQIPTKLLDTATKDPSRLTRIPGSKRPNGNMQQLIMLDKFILCSELERLMPQASTLHKPKQTKVENIYYEQFLARINNYDRRGLKTQLIKLKHSAAPEGFYPEIFRYSIWLFEETSAPIEHVIRYLEENLFPTLREAGYNRNLHRPVEDAYILKGAL